MEKIVKLSSLFLIILIASFCSNVKKEKKEGSRFDKFYTKKIGFKSFNLDSLNVDLNSLTKVDSSDSIYKKAGSKSAEFFYYSVLDTSRIFESVVYLYSNEGKEQCLEMVNYKNDGTIISTLPLFCSGGDAEEYFTLESDFISKNEIKQSRAEGYFNDEDSLIVTDRSFFKVRIKDNGTIKKDSN
ncbi:hypothetical protein [uncultured Tenacibaculum sp.]|uniref:hypothetical protein n=1 Tax=uncultured Tenacibaculum sp. TaxID=174713 RepID=UPI0026070D79|nr:hypothetical protein [uncultured Tenacibaculum sp.]